MSSAAAIIPAVAGAVKAGYGIQQGFQEKNENQRAKSEYQSEAEQASLAHEATYRQDRAGLMSALESYYKKQGWTLPTAQPGTGAGTGRPLPGDAPLYPGYGTPNKGPWNYTQQPVQADTAVVQPTQPGVIQQAPQPVPVQSANSPMQVSGEGEVSQSPVGLKPISTTPQLAQGPGILMLPQTSPVQQQQNLKMIASRLGGQYGY